MTGLRSFFDKSVHCKPEKTRATVYTDDLNLTMMSVNYYYHQQLRPALWTGDPDRIKETRLIHASSI